MAVKAQAPAPRQSLTASDVQAMVAKMSAGAAGGGVQSGPQAGGQGVDPTKSMQPMVAPGTPARPMGEEMNEPAVPRGNQPVAPVTTETTPRVAPSVYPGMTPIPQETTLAEQLSQVQAQLAEIDAQRRSEVEQRKREAEEARIAALPDDQKETARRELAEMRTHQAELKLAAMELKSTHPLFVQFMDVIAETAEIEVDAPGYRTLAAKLEPLIGAIVAKQVAVEKATLDAQVEQQWGFRPTPQQGGVPTPDHPLLQAYQVARDNVSKNPIDPDALMALLRATQEVKEKLNLDLNSTLG